MFEGSEDGPVLVVGAGPVGLVVACELLRRKVPVRLVDTAPRRSVQSKAIIIWPRTLELLAGMGVADELVAAGHRLAGVRFHSDGAVLGSIDVARLPDCRYNHVLMLPQWETERILRANYEALGGAIEWGVELTGLTMGRDGVEVSLSDGSGRTTVPWLVGADGAHSTVRTLLGVDYTVHSPNMTFAIADAPMTGPIDPAYLHYCYSGRGAIGIGPLGDGIFRFAVSVTKGQSADRALFQSAVDERAGRIGTVGELRWSALFDVRCATANRFRVGRAFLAGDAAHVVSPAGGQGLNTGIQDAVNLGWKLAGVVHGTLDESVLDSYHAERHEAVRRVSTVTDRQTRWGLVRRPTGVLVRDTLTRTAAATGLLQRFATPLLCQTDLRYGPTRPWWRRVRRPAVQVGGRLPHIADEFGPATDDPARGTLPTLLLHRGTGAPDWPAVRSALLDVLPPAVPVRELTGDPATPEGRLGALLGPAARAVLVRPDGHVLALAPVTRPEALLHALRSITRPPVAASEGNH